MNIVECQTIPTPLIMLITKYLSIRLLCSTQTLRVSSGSYILSTSSSYRTKIRSMLFSIKILTNNGAKMMFNSTATISIQGFKLFSKSGVNRSSISKIMRHGLLIGIITIRGECSCITNKEDILPTNRSEMTKRTKEIKIKSPINHKNLKSRR